MESISRYHLGRHEDGIWHVIDAKTGGPVEIEVEGRFLLLWGLLKSGAEKLSKGFNEALRKQRHES